jgi:lysophospholipase L1-like esterase
VQTSGAGPGGAGSSAMPGAGSDTGGSAAAGSPGAGSAGLLPNNDAGSGGQGAPSGGAPSGGTSGSGGSAGSGAGGGNAGAGPSSPCPAKGTPCVIMPLGDSITYGYGQSTGGGYRVELFSQALTDNKLVTFVGSSQSGPDTVSGKTFPKGNEGHSGYSIDDSSKTSGISPLVEQAISKYKPNIILLMIGTNDMHYSLDLPNAPTRLGKLLDQITSDAPKALLVVAKIVPANGAQNSATISYNAAIPAVVQQRVAQGKNIALVDMYAALGSWSTKLFKDSEHPNDAGYALMANTWYPAIKGVLP